jgi:hypothetical protein
MDGLSGPARRKRLLRLALLAPAGRPEPVSHIGQIRVGSRSGRVGRPKMPHRFNPHGALSPQVMETVAEVANVDLKPMLEPRVRRLHHDQEYRC